MTLRLVPWLAAVSICLVSSGMAVMAEGTAISTGDPERGAEIFAKCAACHKVGPDATNGVGPHLNGVFGRKAAQINGFRYSGSMLSAAEAGLVWDHDQLNTFIENPRALVARTSMSFRGLSDQQDRRDVLAYLRQFSDPSQSLAEAEPTAPEVILAPEILALQGDVEYGEYLASDCLTCHKSDGGDEGIPSITLWPVEDFVVAMHAYKRKLRPHPVMQMMAGRLSDEEIAALATYFAELNQ